MCLPNLRAGPVDSTKAVLLVLVVFDIPGAAWIASSGFSTDPIFDSVLCWRAGGRSRFGEGFPNPVSLGLFDREYNHIEVVNCCRRPRLMALFRLRPFLQVLELRPRTYRDVLMALRLVFSLTLRRRDM